MARPLVIFLCSPSWEARYLATTTAVTAAAMGDPVHVALFFDPLDAWLCNRFDDGAPPSAKDTGVTSLRAMLEEGRRELGVKIVACDTALKLVGSSRERVPSLDAVLGMPALWKLAQEGQALTY